MTSKLFLLKVILVIGCVNFCLGQTQDSVKHFLLSGSISLMHNGIASIPAFSLNKPALNASLALGKGKFSFEPSFSYALNADPWIIDVPLFFEWNVSSAVKSKSGVNYSKFFDHQFVAAPDGEVVETIRLNRYLILSESISIRLSNSISLHCIYWYIIGLDYFTPKRGHFFRLELPITNTGGSQRIHVQFSPSVFYIKSTLPLRGIFSSASFDVRIAKLPIFWSSQVICPVWTSPGIKFKWSTGVKYNFSTSRDRQSDR